MDDLASPRGPVRAQTLPAPPPAPGTEPGHQLDRGALSRRSPYVAALIREIDRRAAKTAETRRRSNRSR